MKARGKSLIGKFVIYSAYYGCASITLIPMVIWRYAIKSTIWFYGPLLLLATKGAESDTAKRKDKLIANLSFLDWASLIYAVSVLLIAVVSSIDLTELSLNRDAITEAKSPLTFVAAWYAVDLSPFLERPWSWFQLPAAAIAIGCVIWLNQLKQWREAAGVDADDRYPLNRHPGSTIYYLQRFQQVLVCATTVVGLWYFGQWVHSYGGLPIWAQAISTSIYGAN